MLCYLTCGVESAIKINGEFVGKAGENYFIFEAEDGSLLEILPLDNTYLPITRLISGEVGKFSDMRIIDLCGCFLLIPKFSRRSVTDFKLLGHGRIEFSVGTVAVNCYSENGVRLVVETADDMFITGLPFMPDEARFERAAGVGGAEYLLCSFIAKRSLVMAFSVDKKITLQLKRLCDDFSFAPPYISLIENKNDLLKHVIISKWKLETTVVGTNTEIRRRRQPYTLDERLMPYAFFEEVAAGGDVADLLVPKLKPRADEFKEFLGDFTAVLSPPHFLKSGYLLLLYSDGVQYADVSLSGGLIENVTLCHPSEAELKK